MDTNDTKLLKAIHNVEKQVVQLQTQIDDSVNRRFNDVERRVSNNENAILFAVVAIVGTVLTAIISVVIK